MCEVPAFYSETLRKPHKWDGELQTFAQSEAAYHFARWINGIKEGGDVSRYDGEACIPFGGIGDSIDLAEHGAEWERVCRGEVTRWTLATPRAGGAA